MTKKQERICIARLQEYVDIGWNSRGFLSYNCPFCAVFVDMDIHSPCTPCPLNVGCMGVVPKTRRRLIQEDPCSYWKAARNHARWLMRKYSAAGLEVEIVDEV